MRTEFRSFVLGALCASAPFLAHAQAVAPEVAAPLPRAVAISEIQKGISELEQVHPDLYFATSRASFKQLERNLLQHLPKTPTQIDVYLVLSRLISTLEDGHIGVGPPSPIQEAVPPPTFGGKNLRDIYFAAGSRLLPFSVTLDKNGVVRIGQLYDSTQQVHSGDRLLTLNGKDALQLFREAEQLNSGEPADRQDRTERAFGFMLWALNIAAPFHVTVQAQHSTEAIRSVTLNGASLEQFQGATQQTDGKPRDTLRYELLADGIGRLDFNSMTASLPQFKEQLAAIFAQIQKDHPKGLVIDVRRNGGGHSSLGEALLDYIADKPYRLSSEKHWKVSDQCKTFYTVNHSDERKYLAAPTGSYIDEPEPFITPSSNPIRYSGPVAVLIGPETFSSANQFANAVGDLKLATLIGQPTAERANHFGELCGFVLPESRIEVFSSSALFTRANGNRDDMGDVLPDIAVPRTTNSSSDPDMVAAEHFLLKGSHSR